MIGILVHGDNHFIVEGPRPDGDTAAALATHWSLIQIGAAIPPALTRWKIINKALREHLEWAVIVPSDSAISPAVTALLNELSARGVPFAHGVD